MNSIFTFPSYVLLHFVHIAAQSEAFVGFWENLENTTQAL
jgi:hypothetical protein